MSCQCRRCRCSFSIPRGLFSSSELPRFYIPPGQRYHQSIQQSPCLKPLQYRYPYLCQITTCWDWLWIYWQCCQGVADAVPMCRLLNWRVYEGRSWRRYNVIFFGEWGTHPAWLYATYRAILKIHFDKRNAELMQLFRRVMSWVLLVWSLHPLYCFLPMSNQTWMGSLIGLTRCWVGPCQGIIAPHLPTPYIPTRLSARHY